MLIHFIVLTLVLILDQISKAIIIHYQYAYILNPGIAFSIPLPNIVAIPVSIIVILWLYKFILQNKPHSQMSFIALGMVVGGAIGNLIDRIRLEAVIDFISIPPFPSFNIADASITLGMFVILFSLYKNEKAKVLQ